MNNHKNKQKLRLVHHPVYKQVFTRLLGKHHTKRHRLLVGFVVMAIGVCVAKQGHHFEHWTAEYSIDLIGYLIHGIGATPLLEEVI